LKTKDWDWERPGAVRKASEGAGRRRLVSPQVKEQIEAIAPRSCHLYDSTDEPSQITYLRVREVLEQWRDAIVQARLVRDKKPAVTPRPIEVKGEDVAPESGRRQHLGRISRSCSSSWR